MLLSHKSFLTIFRVWFVSCAYLSQCTCAPVGTDDATSRHDLQLADSKKPDQASDSQVELVASLVPDISTIPTEIDIAIDASPSGRDEDKTQPPPNNDNELPGWLAMYIEYITWLWGLVTSFATWIIANILPIVLFGAACVATGAMVAGISCALVGLSRAIVAGPTSPTERTPLNRSL